MINGTLIVKAEALGHLDHNNRYHLEMSEIGITAKSIQEEGLPQLIRVVATPDTGIHTKTPFVIVKAYRDGVIYRQAGGLVEIVLYND